MPLLEECLRAESQHGGLAASSTGRDNEVALRREVDNALLELIEVHRSHLKRRQLRTRGRPGILPPSCCRAYF